MSRNRTTFVIGAVASAAIGIYGLTVTGAFAETNVFDRFLKDANPPSYEGNYFCKAIASGGLFYDEVNKSWSGASFNTGDTQFVLGMKERPESKAEPLAMLRFYDVDIKDMQSGQVSKCTKSKFAKNDDEARVPVDKSAMVYCTRSLYFDYTINMSTLRYINTYMAFFLTKDEEEPKEQGEAPGVDTPYIQGGQCVKLN
ncbi:hypothetical protein [Rhizobium leguminosarum]|uniref:hypothetical protein n=1 Tax=Rhizobium leguminosarum TaxID=384 RepID=UPI0036D85FEB